MFIYGKQGDLVNLDHVIQVAIKNWKEKPENPFRVVAYFSGEDGSSLLGEFQTKEEAENLIESIFSKLNKGQ